MSAIAIRGLLRRRRRHLALIAVVMALAAVIVVHHSAMVSSMDHGTGMGMGAVADMCLAVFAAVGATVVAVTIGMLMLGRSRPALTLASRARPAARPPMVRVRDGPALLLLLCVCRR